MLNTNSDFPNLDNVDVYKFDNDFDYARFDKTQMELQLCDVPWDVGEAHVGQRTISGIGNVVYFGTPEARDAWFAAIPEAEPGEDPTGKCFRFETKFKELHRDQIIDVPIPYNVAALFNYLVVRYKPFASEDSYVEYETGLGKMDWFWFVREVEFVSANTTRLYLLDDAFQTWIYDVNVAGMLLERGHAPMFEMRADAYLENPLDNNQGLLCEDVNFGQADIVKHIDALALNAGDMWACIATTASPQGPWGSKANNDWNVPTNPLYTNNGTPSFFVFAVEPAKLETLMTNIAATYPQFAQTVQGVFFAPKNMVQTAQAFTFAGVECKGLTSNRSSFELMQLSKGLFGYDEKYADIAKLYTSPYAHIEISDENGNVDIIKIEDTTGTLNVSAAFSLAYPFVTIDAHLLGAGGSTQTSITFKNITDHTFDIQGRWYETLRQWKVPTFAVTLAPNTEYDYSTHFDRAQRKVDYETEYANATASAITEQTNANASSNTDKSNTATIAAAAKSNADASANTDVSNTALQVAGNTAITSRSNSSALSDASLANALSQASQAWEAGYTRDTTNNEVNAEYASAAIGAAGGVAGSVVSGAMSGGAIGAIGGLLSGAISGATSIANTAVAANLKSTQAEATISLSQNKVTSTNTNNTDRTNNQNSANSDNANTTNTTSTGVTANSAATQKANASRTQSAQNSAATATNNTNVANNQRTYDTAVANAGRDQARAISAIANDTRQAALRAPFVYGTFADGDGATTKPMALFSNIVTQSKSAIANAGDEFLRYGYMYDAQWPFDGNWNIGKYFTYWKLKDFWVRDLQVPDLYMDKLRFFLFGGVTIWRKPEYIGKVSIYDNFKQ